ncbi:MAG TPA: type VI secretion system ImpA family N-terminal domain-containing protein [Victivallales bacterium]|nr:type VI secretion system ImpA family N-terminal domain-containing protein [Victivallales bacterium]
MSQITLKKLLEPIRNDDPCGEYLEDHGDFYILKEMINGKEETQWSAYEPPDWKNILRMSKGLLLRGKNIWVVVFYTYASTEIYGLEGLIKGLELLKDMLDKFWDNIQPHLDSEDEDDYTLSRLSPFATMASPHEHLCTMLKTMHLIETQRIGKFSYEDIKTLADETAVRGAGLENIEFEHISSDINKEKYTETVNSLKDIIKLCSEINDFITEKVGEQNNVSNLNNLIKFIEEMISLFNEHIKTVSEVEPVFEKPTEQVNSPVLQTVSQEQTVNTNGVINSEQDVLNMFKQINDWYKLNLPTSPVPFVVNKAINLIGKDFMEALSIMMERKSFKASLNTDIRFNEDENKNIDTELSTEAVDDVVSKKTVGDSSGELNDREILF